MTSNAVLLDLVAHGVQDLFLIGNPQITFFKAVFKRHTNFSMSPVLCPIDGVVDFGNRIVVNVPRSGDLMHTVLFEIDLPALTSTYTAAPGYSGPASDFANGQGVACWINNIGHGLIDHIDMRIGDQLIDTHYGEWMEIWTQLSQDEGQKRGLDAMLHRSPNSNDGPSSLNLTSSLTAYIPFQFWFCRNIGLALPLIALQYHNVEFDIFLSPLNRLYTFGPYDYYTGTGTNGGTTVQLVKIETTSRDLDFGDNGKNIVFPDGSQYWIHPTIPITGNGTQSNPFIVTLTSPLTTSYNNAETYIKPNGVIVGIPTITAARFYIDMIYLDTYERREFSQQKLRYLIEQVQTRPPDSIVGSVSSTYQINFNLAVKELFWVTQLNRVTRDNDIFNFSDTVNSTSVRNNVMQTCLIQYNGMDRFPQRNGDYFRIIQPYFYHTRVPLDFFYIYSLSFSPEEYQPSGVTNFSKIDKVSIIITVESGLDTISFRCYGLNYNILRITNGMGGVAFSN